MTNPSSRVWNPGVALLPLFLVASACGASDDSSGGGDADGSGGDAGSGDGGGGDTGSSESGSGGDAGSSESGSGGGPRTPDPVALGLAEDYVILAKSGISTVPASAITGDLGLSPAAASYLTGFTLTQDATNAFSSSAQVTGKVYAADYAAPTPSNLTDAVGDMELAFADAAGRAPDVTELGAGSIGGMTLDPGVYHWGTGLAIATDVTLAGSETDVWILQTAEDLTVSSAASVLLTGGARASNVFWQVSGQVVLGTTAHFEGVVLTQTSATLRTGATIRGRLLVQTAVSLDGNDVVEPGE